MRGDFPPFPTAQWLCTGQCNRLQQQLARTSPVTADADSQ